MTQSNSNRNALITWLGLASIVILLDQISKITVNRTFQYMESVELTSFFNFTLLYNRGAAFSFLAGEAGWQRYFFTGIAVVAAIVITYLIRKNSHAKLFCFALSLILGGAMGNVIDRMVYGYVIDFLDFHYANHHFPAFNLADSAITLGAILFIIDELKRVKK